MSRTSYSAANAFGKSLLLLSLAALGGCAASSPGQRYASLSGPGAIDPRYGVRASPRVVADGEEVPKGGGSYMVGKPYKIAGQTYVPSEKPYVATGTASWYGSDFHGRRTANGEIFDRDSISAAHPTMPLPSYARVTNINNSRSIVVRVNDRGPYHGGRVMDVSQRVAEALDFHSAGTTKVKVEWIGRANLAGDDDRKLLATLRDDGQPASIEGMEPTMVAARQEPVRMAARQDVAETPVVSDAASRPDAGMMAYASTGGAEAADEAAPAEEAAPAARPRSVDKVKGFQAAPMPPARPSSLGRREASAPRPPIRQALD